MKTYAIKLGAVRHALVRANRNGEYDVLPVIAVRRYLFERGIASPFVARGKYVD